MDTSITSYPLFLRSRSDINSISPPEQQQIHRVQADTHMGGQKAEHRRHEGGAQIGACHLDTDDGLGIFPAEVVGGGVNDGGVDWRAAKAHNDQSCQSRKIG